MLDPARRFIPVEYIKETIDRMASFKMNTIHLHLADDQGWRMEMDPPAGASEQIQNAWRNLTSRAAAQPEVSKFLTL